MRKLLVLLALLMGISIHSMAQSYTEVVYLKNGTIIRGLIIEEVPNTSLKIQTSDGSIFAYKMEEIQKITKEIKGTSQRNKTKSNKVKGYSLENRKSYTKSHDSGNSMKGYKGFVDAGYIFDLNNYNANRLEVSTTHGYQFNNSIFVGGGLGMHYYTDVNLYSVPVFASFRINFMDKKITPFADVQSGYSIGDIEGIFGTLGVGVRLALANKKALNLKLTYQYLRYEFDGGPEHLSGVGIKLGFEF